MVGPAGGGLQVELDWGATAAAEARAALSTLESRVDGEVLDDVRLLVSELVTNSVRHSGASPERSVVLQVATSPGTVHVEVTDEGEGFAPRPRAEGQSEASGWGLHLVDRIAHRWGVERDGETRVWFEIDEG